MLMLYLTAVVEVGMASENELSFPKTLKKKLVKNINDFIKRKVTKGAFF